MRFSSIAKTTVAVVGITTIGITNAATASADTQVVKFGEWGRLHDVGTVTGWRIDSLQPSSATIPQYPVTGRLWQANARVRASTRGGVTPVIPNLNARADNGQNYQVLWQAFTPDGISGATLPPGDKASGKIYFDVTGADPTKVAYNDGAEDLIVWQK